MKTFIKKYWDTILGGVILGLLIGLTWIALADAHYVNSCKKYTCKAHVIEPFIKPFLGPVGKCEGSPKFGATLSIYTGLKAISANGYYRGRYQFGIPDWRNAGGVRISGHTDPRGATATDQAYIAVIWLHVNGRTSWPNC